MSAIEADGRTCTKCGETKPSRFFPSYKTRCKPCLADSQRDYRKKRPKSYWKNKDKKYALKKRYGISIEAFEQMADAQGWKCAICGIDPRHQEVSRESRRILHVDHDHQTGKVRALLCNGCNRAIGLINERPNVADNMADYLRRYSR